MSCSPSCSKCQHYSPNESNKAYDKTITRKAGVMFEPKLVIEEVKSETLGRRSLKSKEEYLKQYIAVRLSLRHTVHYQVYVAPRTQALEKSGPGYEASVCFACDMYIFIFVL